MAKFYKVTRVKAYPLRKRKRDIPRKKGFRRLWFDRKGRPSKFSSRKKLRGYVFRVTITKTGRAKLKQKARQRKVRKKAEKRARKVVQTPWKKLKWQQLQPYVYAILDAYKVPRESWEASLAGAMAMIPDFDQKLVYMPLQFFYSEPLTDEEMGVKKNGNGADPGKVGYLWAIVSVPRSLRDYVVRGRLYLPRGEEVAPTYQDRHRFNALLGLPVTWTSLKGQKRGRSSGRLIYKPLVTVKEFHRFLTTKARKSKMVMWKETIDFYARNVKVKITPIHFVGFTMRLIPGG